MKDRLNQQVFVRTQVILTPELISSIEKARKIKKESRSAYLRKAALLRLSQEKKQKANLAVLADSVIGSLSLRGHPVWSNEASVEEWHKSIRSEWE
jgi:hypothetical protein